MKKIFTLVAMATMALAANAQVEGTTLDVSSLDKDGTQTAAGISLGKSAHVTVATGTEDSKKTTGYKTTSSKYNDVEAVVVTDKAGNKVVIDTNTGVTGSDNARNEAGVIPGASISAIANGAWVAATGCTYSFAVGQGLTDDFGEMYVAGKFSGNKEFLVLEDGEPIPYTLIYDANADNSAIAIIEPADMGYDTENFVWKDGATIPTPDTKMAFATQKKNGTGVVVFDVAPGRTYIVTANGSKPTISGYALVNGDVAETVELARMGRDADGNATTQEQSVYLVKAGEFNKTAGYEDATYEIPTSTGINTVATAQAENAVSYNAVGQRVNASAKGLVIRNGKKFMNK